MSRWTRGSRRVVVLAIVVTVVCAVFGAGVAAHEEGEPAIVVSDVEIAEDDRATATVTLTSAPTGLAGYDVNVTARNGTVRVTNVTVAEAFSVHETSSSDDGTDVQIRGVDLQNEIGEGATDVELATIEYERVDSGDDSLEVTINQLDDDEGEGIEAGTHTGAVTEPDGFALGFGGAASTLWFVVTAFVALTAAAGIRLRGRT